MTTTRLPERTKPGELVLRLRQPPRRDRGALRLELERLAAREGVELGRALERERLEALLLPDRAHVVRLPDEVGRAIERGDEVVGDRLVDPACPSSSSHRVRRLEVDRSPRAAPPPDRRSRSVTGVERPLREGRERAHLLDLVTEELDAQRLAAGRREDVDDAAAHRELTPFLDPVDALVAGARKRLGEARRGRARRRRRAAPAAGRTSGGGMPSASAAADAHTSPPAARTSSARARSPTRCGGGSSPEACETPRLGRSATRSRPRNHDAPSAASRASASSGRRTSSPRPSSSYSVASTSGSAASETRARAGRAFVKAWKRSLAASSRDECVKRASGPCKRRGTSPAGPS